MTRVPSTTLSEPAAKRVPPACYTRGRLRKLIFATLIIGCASKQALPPGDELEHAANSQSGPPERASTMPNVDGELASAFDAPKAAPKPQPNRAAEPPPLTLPDEAWEDPAKQDEQIRSEFKDGLAQGTPGPVISGWDSWRKQCGPYNVDGCRAQNLKAVSQMPPGSQAAVKGRVKTLREDDACVQKVERARTADKCLDSAIAAYAREGDKLMRQRVLLARVLLAIKAGKNDEVPQRLKDAEKACTELRCALQRRKIYGLGRRLLEKDEPELAVAWALKDAQVAASLVSPAVRPWSRPKETDEACAAFDAKNGQGSCRALEKKLNGQWLFADFSSDRLKGGLAADQVKRVNEHFNCLAQECLSLEAGRLVPPEQAIYEVRWVVKNDGRVGEVHFARKEHEQGPLAECLRKQFAWWRYPRYEGEWQNVEQRFTVSAHERRTR